MTSRDEYLRALEKKWRARSVELTAMENRSRAYGDESTAYARGFASFEVLSIADELAALLSDRQEVAPVAGPWSAIAVGGKIVVASEEFGNDVWLYVTGDFDDTDAHLEYADRIARILNSTGQTSDARDSRYREAIVNAIACRHDFNTSVDMADWLNDELKDIEGDAAMEASR